MADIPINGVTIQVDDDDVHILSDHRWRVAKSGNGRHFVARAGDGRLLKHLLLNVERVHVAHIDGDWRNHHKSNLTVGANPKNIPASPSTITLNGECATVSLDGSRQVTIVDIDDVAFVSGYRWILTSQGYAFCGQLQVCLHRRLLAAPDGWEVDHRDGDKLNNRRENLRIATSQENSRNAKKPKWRNRNATSEFKGVYVAKESLRKPYKATVSVGGRSVHLGWFATEIDAARAYDEAARKLFGEFARTNF